MINNLAQSIRDIEVMRIEMRDNHHLIAFCGLD